MTRRARSHARAKSGPSTSADWSALLAAAEACCRDLDPDVQPDRDADLRRMTFRRMVLETNTGLFQTECGYAACQAANGFMELARAFSSSREPTIQAALVPSLRATAAFLDTQLHASRQRAFEAAHRNRPEVF